VDDEVNPEADTDVDANANVDVDTGVYTGVADAAAAAVHTGTGGSCVVAEAGNTGPAAWSLGIVLAAIAAGMARRRR